MEVFSSSQSIQTAESKRIFHRFAMRLRRMLGRPIDISGTPANISDTGASSDCPEPTAGPSMLDSDLVLHLFCKSVASLEKTGGDGTASLSKLTEAVQAVYAEIKCLVKMLEGALLSKEKRSPQNAMEDLQVQVECALDELIAKRAKLMWNLNGLAEIETKLKRLSQQNSNFKRVAKNLKLVGLNISIENVRCHEAKTAYQVLADVINQLAQKMAATAEYISDDTQRILHHLESIHGELDTHRQRLDTDIGASQKAVEDALTSAKNITQIIQNILEHVELGFSTVKNQAGELVADVQIHEDIFRRIAYIASSINEAIDYMENAFSTGSRPQDTPSAFGRAENINRLQISQLNILSKDITKTGKQTEAALEDLLSAIRSAAKFQSMDLTVKDAITRLETQIIRPPMEVLRTVVKDLIDLSDQGMSNISRVRRANRQVGSAIQTMVGHLDHVRNINFDVHLKALNSVIKSTRLGKTGKAIESIVLEMKSIAEQSDATFQTVIGLMEDVTNASHLLDQSALEPPPLRQDTTGQLLCQGIENFSTACDGFKNHLQTAVKLGVQLQEKVLLARQETDFFNQMATVFNDCNADLEKVESLFRPFMDTIYTDWLTKEKQAMEPVTLKNEWEAADHQSEGKEGSANPFAELAAAAAEKDTIEFF